MASLVESQEEEFKRRIGKILVDLEGKDRRYQALEEEVKKKDVAFKISKVNECDLLVMLDQAEQTVVALTRNSKKNEAASSSLAKPTKEGLKAPPPPKKKGSIPYFPGACHFCHFKGHKQTHCKQYTEYRNKHVGDKMVKRKVTQMWVRKNKSDQVGAKLKIKVKATPIEKVYILKRKEIIDSPTTPLNSHSGSTSGVTPPLIA